jgi:hypothetical protein
MRILLTTSDNWVSNAIRYLTKEPASHIALCQGSFVFHSTFTGMEITTTDEFFRTRKLVASCDVDKFSYPLLMETLSRKHSYDFPGLLYLGLRYLCKRYLGVKLPKANLWNISGIYTCTEFVTRVVFGMEDTLITPYQLYLKLDNSHPSGELT